MLALHLFETDDEHQKISDAFRCSSVPDHFQNLNKNFWPVKYYLGSEQEFHGLDKFLNFAVFLIKNCEIEH